MLLSGFSNTLPGTEVRLPELELPGSLSSLFKDHNISILSLCLFFQLLTFTET